MGIKQLPGYTEVKYWINSTRELELEKKYIKRLKQSFLIAAQNNATWTNYAKAKIGNLHKCSKCRLCGDRDETITHIITK